jgi:nitroreductase
MRKRINKYQIDNLLFNRDSPREMTGERISGKELMPLFEAARWAPSSYNAQLWRFIYVIKGKALFTQFLDLLGPSNLAWAKNAGALVVVTTRNNFEYNEKISRTAQFDAGAACQNLSLEGFKRGYVIHLMEGFSYQKAANLCEVPKSYKVLAMIVIGKRTKIHEKRSSRRPLREIVSEGILKNKR